MGHVKTAQNSLFNGAGPITISMVTAPIQSETFHASTMDAGFDNLSYDGFTVHTPGY